MHHQRVALAHESEQSFQLGTLRVLARRLVHEQAIERNAFRLPLRVLVKTTDADVADTLTLHQFFLFQARTTAGGRTSAASNGTAAKYRLRKIVSFPDKGKGRRDPRPFHS